MRRLALVVAVAVVAACSGGITGPTSTSTTSSTTTGVSSPSTAGSVPSTTLPTPNEVVVGFDQEPTTLNPYAPGGRDFIVTEIGRALNSGLTEIDGATLETVPDLAAEVPSVANGGVSVADDGTTTVTFRIRDEAVWEDGAPVTGDDVVFTYETIIAIADQPYLTDPYQKIAAIEADGKTVTLTFDEPTLSFETMFPTVIPAHQVRGTDPVAGWNDPPWLASGPFRFESWTSHDAITLVRNDAYWKTGPQGQQLPYLDRVVIRFIPDTEALIRAFVDRDIDIFQPPPDHATVTRLRSLEGAEVTVLAGPIWEHLTFQFGENNRNSDSLNQYLEFRRAVALAIDRQALLDLGIWEATRPLDALLDLYGLPTDRPWSQYAHDPQRAADLIAGLCGDLGRDCEADPPVVVFSTTSNADERPRIAALLVDLLGEAGIEVRLELEDSSIFFGPTLTNGTWDLGEWAWVATPGPSGVLASLSVYDPDSPLTGDPNLGWQGLSGTNDARWGTPAVSGWPTAESPYAIDLNQGPSRVRDDHTARYAEVLDEMAATADHARFATLAREAEHILADQVVIIPLIARNDVGAVWADEIGGYAHTPRYDTWNIETWHRLDG